MAAAEATSWQYNGWRGGWPVAKAKPLLRLAGGVLQPFGGLLAGSGWPTGGGVGVPFRGWRSYRNSSISQWLRNGLHRQYTGNTGCSWLSLFRPDIGEIPPASGGWLCNGQWLLQSRLTLRNDRLSLQWPRLAGCVAVENDHQEAEISIIPL